MSDPVPRTVSNWGFVVGIVLFGGITFAATALEGVRGAEVVMGLMATTCSGWFLFRMAAFGSRRPLEARMKLAAQQFSLVLVGLGMLTPPNFLLPYRAVQFAFLISAGALQIAALFAVPKKLFGRSPG
jgi:hypothetical protein